MSARSRAPALCALLMASASAGTAGQERSQTAWPEVEAAREHEGSDAARRGSVFGRSGPWPQGPIASVPTTLSAASFRARAPGPEPATVTLLSLGLPGVGQHMLGKRRKWLYLAVEAVGWTFYLERRAAGGRARDRYRDFAWENARLMEGPRAEGDFDFYETLTHWTRSGTFDSDAQVPGLQPEPDEQTFNGAIWTLALQIHLPAGATPGPGTPGYDAALAYYQERAYGPGFLWDWSTFPDGQAELSRLIEESDDRFRQATTVLGAVLANHLISAVDAYVSARGLAASTGLRVRPEARPGTGRWNVLWSLPVR